MISQAVSDSMNQQIMHEIVFCLSLSLHVRLMLGKKFARVCRLAAGSIPGRAGSRHAVL